tara:strand:- start:15847 stop:16065 length:219 start_codon:yes stop_codon:yes gene_type:complete
MRFASARLVLLTSFVSLLSAQQPRPSQDELLEQKLQSPFLKNAAWHTDWQLARREATASKKLIFGYFTTVNY